MKHGNDGVVCENVVWIRENRELRSRVTLYCLMCLNADTRADRDETEIEDIEERLDDENLNG